MAKKMPIGLFVKELAVCLERKDGYIMGATGQDPKKMSSWWFNQYSGSQKTKALYWKEHCARVWDCNGLAEGLYKDYSGTDINTQAKYNYSQWCDPKGSGIIPAKYRTAGAAVFWGDKPSSIHHVAYLYKPVDANKPTGDWYLIEARGVSYGVVRTRLLIRRPNYWGLMTKYFDYDGNEIRPDAGECTLGERLLKNGSEGSDVRQLQEILLQRGYALPKYGADGDYGAETAAAVKKLQIDLGVEDDGEYGDITHEALMACLARESLPGEDDPAPAVKVRVTASQSAYVRSGPDTSYSIITVVRNGAVYDSSAASENGWFCICADGRTGWISGRMCEPIPEQRHG